MRPIPTLLLVSLVTLAGCAASDPQGTGSGVTSFLNRTPGAKAFTGQGEMGTGSAGNSSGASGPSQEPGDPADRPR